MLKLYSINTSFSSSFKKKNQEKKNHCRII